MYNIERFNSAVLRILEWVILTSLKNKQNKNLYIISKHNGLWLNDHFADLADPVRNKH